MRSSESTPRARELQRQGCVFANTPESLTSKCGQHRSLFLASSAQDRRPGSKGGASRTTSHHHHHHIAWLASMERLVARHVAYHASTVCWAVQVHAGIIYVSCCMYTHGTHGNPAVFGARHSHEWQSFVVITMSRARLSHHEKHACDGLASPSQALLVGLGERIDEQASRLEALLSRAPAWRGESDDPVHVIPACCSRLTAAIVDERFRSAPELLTTRFTALPFVTPALRYSNVSRMASLWTLLTVDSPTRCRQQWRIHCGYSQAFVTCLAHRGCWSNRKGKHSPAKRIR